MATLKEQSAIWWNRTKSSDTSVNAWLLKQFVGEYKAHGRLNEYLERFNPPVKIRKVVEKIASQELKHAAWVAKLLTRRGFAHAPVHEDRYWKHTLKGIKTFDQLCGVAWAAENMRLARIEVIAADKTAPKDIRRTFQKILKEERFHEKAFGTLSSVTAKTRAIKNHKKGLKAIGLVA